MKAITLTRPWPWTIFHLPPPAAKRIENRGFRPVSLIGDVLAFHAGHKFDADVAKGLASVFPSLSLDEAAHPKASIIGLATIRSAVPYPPHGHLPEDRRKALVRERLESIHVDPDQERWFFGPLGWILDDVITLAEPVPCVGTQGLWDVPADAERAIWSQIETGR